MMRGDIETQTEASLKASMRSYFSVNPPARSFVPVASWPMEFNIEIECVAVA